MPSPVAALTAQTGTSPQNARTLSAFCRQSASRSRLLSTTIARAPLLRVKAR